MVQSRRPQGRSNVQEACRHLIHAQRTERTAEEASVFAVRRAARDRAAVSGLTHTFYRYPARFSPQFAAAAIEAFSEPGDLVLDPYMGGATTLVEAIARGRRAVGCDLNSLAVFIARAKTTIP